MRCRGSRKRVTAPRPDLLGAEATFGELAWNWGAGLTAVGETWRRRLVCRSGDLVAWGWAHLPHRVVRTDGSVREARKSSLAYQYHPDHPEALAEVLDWFGDAVLKAPDGTMASTALMWFDEVPAQRSSSQSVLIRRTGAADSRGLSCCTGCRWPEQPEPGR